jgi:hypothetical protein
MGDEGRGGGGKARIRLAEFKTLAAFLQGYLHQDFRAEYKTPVAALEAYCREASPGEVKKLKIELARFVRQSRAWPFPAVQETLGREFHCGWLPRRRADLVRLLTALGLKS